MWDDARRLVALNERLRAELEDWPAWLVAIGQAEGDPCGYAIDTRSPESPVWWLEKCGSAPPADQPRDSSVLGSRSGSRTLGGGAERTATSLVLRPMGVGVGHRTDCILAQGYLLE